MKRWRMVFALTVLVIFAGAVALAEAPVPVIHGPFPLDRPLESSLDIRWDEWTPTTTQVIPEGCFGNGYKTWLVVYNSTDQEARISIVASGENLYFTTGPFGVLPHQRQTHDAERLFAPSMRLKDCWKNPNVSFQILSDTPGVYAQVTMINGTMGYTSQGFFK